MCVLKFFLFSGGIRYSILLGETVWEMEESIVRKLLGVSTDATLDFSKIVNSTGKSSRNAILLTTTRIQLQKLLLGMRGETTKLEDGSIEDAITLYLKR